MYNSTTGGIFFFQAEDGIRDRSPSRGLGDVYKRQMLLHECPTLFQSVGFLLFRLIRSDSASWAILLSILSNFLSVSCLIPSIKYSIVPPYCSSLIIVFKKSKHLRLVFLMKTSRRCFDFLNTIIRELQYGGTIEYLMEGIRQETDKKLLRIDNRIAQEAESLRINLKSKNPTDWNKVGHSCRSICLLYTSPSPRDGLLSRMPSSA